MRMPFIEAVFKFLETIVDSTIHLLKNGPEKKFIILISYLSFLFLHEGNIFDFPYCE